MGQAHAALVEAASRLEGVVTEERGRADREDLLRFQVNEIDTLRDALEKEKELSIERERLRHAEKLGTAAGEAEARLYSDDDSICGALSRTASSVEHAAGFDPSLQPMAAQIREALVQLEDAASELGGYARNLSFEPGRLAALEDQLDGLSRVKRKYGGNAAEILAYRDQAAEELDSLERYEERLDRYQREYDEALEEASRAALALRSKRQTAAAKLSKAISKELSSLGMGEAKVTVELAALEGGPRELQVEGARLSPTGIDHAELLIAPNRGEEAKPLRKIASGGELSRAMLAIKRVLAGLGPASLYVFDEVDAGVGGAVAEVIGRKIHEVAQHSQVLCITHLPQISAYADAHYRVHQRGGRQAHEERHSVAVRYGAPGRDRKDARRRHRDGSGARRGAGTDSRRGSLTRHQHCPHHTRGSASPQGEAGAKRRQARAKAQGAAGRITGGGGRVV